MEERQGQVRAMMQRDYPDFYRIAFIVMVVGVLILIGLAAFTEQEAYHINLWTTLITIILTYLVFDWRIKRQETRLVEAQTRRELLVQLRNRGKDPSQVALDMLLDRGWLYDGTLEGAYLNRLVWPGIVLIEAMLPFVKLEDAQVQGAKLDYTVLYGAWMDRINLEQAQLYNADLRYVWLRHANLQQANLRDALLQGADLTGTNLGFVSLEKADLRDANLRDIKGFEFIIYDEETIWPDGKKYEFPNAEVVRFVDPLHPEFWQPEREKLKEEQRRKWREH